MGGRLVHPISLVCGANMAEKFLLKHSSIENKRPSPDYMVPGELALNLSEQTPGLFFKDVAGNVRKVGPVTVSNNPPNSTPSPGGQPGNSVGEMWVNPLAGNSISVWTGSEWEPAGAVGYVSEEPPAEPENGQLWFDTVERELKTWVESSGTWVGYRENSSGISISNAIAIGTGNNPYEIFVDSATGTDSFLNDGTDSRRPFRTLNRALIEAAKKSIKRGSSNDEYDRILIRCRNGDNVVYNGLGSESVEEARTWGPVDQQGILSLRYNRFIDGANLLLANKDWIVSRAFNALSQSYYIEYPESEELVEKATGIKKLLAKGVEAIAKDLKSAGNSHTLGYAKDFYNGEGVLIAFTNLAIKDLFANVALPVFKEKALLSIQNRGAAQDDTLSLDTSATKLEDLCSNVQQAVLSYVTIIENTLNGSLDLSVKPNLGTYPTEPTREQLMAFNDPILGGLIIPRGVSIQGADLRKTSIVPDYVPTSGEEGFSIFRFTGGSFFFNFTFKDNPSVQRSHHRLSCFSFATESQLSLFYKKVARAFGLDSGDVEVRNPEKDIVFSGGDVDTTLGSSPYVFNCSVRSDYGLSGLEADGSLVGGLKSVVAAQFTNVSLQKDASAWEIFDGSVLEWREALNYQEVVSTPVENVRYKKGFRHYAFRAKNGSYMQIVSCFVIGNSVHYWAQTGGDISITNSTSNFGGTSCLAEGFLGQGTTQGALPQDSDFAVEQIVLPLRLPISEEENPAANAQRILVGVFNGFDEQPSYVDLYLQENFSMSRLSGYEIKQGSRIYFTDISGEERFAVVSSFPNQNPNNPDDKGDVIRLSAGTDVNGWEGNEGREIYIKRFFDFRGTKDRAYKLRVRTTKTGTRRPQINFIFRLISGGTVGQVQVIQSGSQLDNLVSGQRDHVFFIANVEDVPATETETEFDTFDLTILSLDSFGEYDPEYKYSLGDVTLYQGKLYRSLQSLNLAQTPSTAKLWWEQIRFQQQDPDGVPMEALYAAVRQKLDIDDGTATMGITREDYDSKSQNLTLKSVDRFLEIMGYDLATRDSVLQPRDEGSRTYDPTLLPDPVGGAALRSNNWPVEFNRPSLIRASGHTWEWTGYFNYSKAIPSLQNSILSEGNRETSLATENYGGRVYANGLTEEGELFQNGKVIPRQSLVEQSGDFDPVNTGIVSKLSNLQIGSCESPEPSQSWLSTDNLKVCSDIAFTQNTLIRDRFALPSGVRANYGTGVVGTADGIQYGFARPATLEEAGSGTDRDHYLTAFLLKEASKFEVGKISFFASNTFTTELYSYYLVCDGSLVSKASFPKLYNFLRGVDYNTPVDQLTQFTAIYGETASQFRLPDLRGRFVRGWSGATESRGSGAAANTIDVGRGITTRQNDELRSHTHPLSDPGHRHFWDNGQDSGPGSAGEGRRTGILDEPTSIAYTGITIGSAGGDETRPYNIALLPVIRYQ